MGKVKNEVIMRREIVFVVVLCEKPLCSFNVAKIRFPGNTTTSCLQ